MENPKVSKLKQVAALGAIAEEIQKTQIASAVGHENTLEKAAIQLDAAQICVQTAINHLETIPNSSSWLLCVFLRMVSTQLIHYANSLREVKEQNGKT